MNKLAEIKTVNHYTQQNRAMYISASHIVPCFSYSNNMRLIVIESVGVQLTWEVKRSN